MIKNFATSYWSRPSKNGPHIEKLFHSHVMSCQKRQRQKKSVRSLKGNNKKKSFVLQRINLQNVQKHQFTINESVFFSLFAALEVTSS
jgi:hypothetical protein